MRAPIWRSSGGTQSPTRKTSPAAQRTGGHRRVATRKTTGDLATRRGAGDPVRRAEWTTVFRYGHLRSAPVVVDVGLRAEWSHPAPCILVALHAPVLAPPRWLTASPTTRNCVCRVLALQDIATCSQFRSRSSREMQVPEVIGPEGRERCRSTVLVSCRGLWASMRQPVFSGHRRFSTGHRAHELRFRVT